ncbi:MAG: hypothetical protein HY226_05220 [Candidatus Vogelbacteria bacterium]|nr:hypothetical protein [Candidatus Vogelbacteria bacterium]
MSRLKIVVFALVLLLVGWLGVTYMRNNTNKVGNNLDMAKDIVVPVVPLDLSLSNNLQKVKFVYSEDNGSVPPKYFQKHTLTIFESKAGVVSGGLDVSDSKNNITKKQNVIVTKDEFRRIVDDATKITGGTKDLGGCTGGSNQNVQLFNSDKVIMTRDNYICANNSTNDSLKMFTKELQQIILSHNPDLK